MYKRIRDLREDADLNQTQVAKMLGMSQTGYSKYETGENDIPTPVGTFLDGATSISKCKLTWEDRTTAETSPKKAKVLVLSDCTISGGGIPFEPIDPAI